MAHRSKRRRIGAGVDPLVKEERKSLHHWLLEKNIANLCAANKIKPLTTRHIDILLHRGGVSVLFEMKACGIHDAGPQVRHAIYQLLE
jgi:hypothetical protein